MLRPRVGISLSACVVIGAVCCWMGSASGVEETGQERSFQAEVVDPGAYLKDGSRGPDQADQTYQAVESGQTLALLDEPSGSLYLLLADNPGDDPNTLVYDYVNQKVQVSGWVYAKGGVQGIVLTSVEPLEPSESAAASPVDAPPSMEALSTEE